MFTEMNLNRCLDKIGVTGRRMCGMSQEIKRMIIALNFDAIWFKHRDVFQ
jgi:hypothetical protein